MLPRSDTCPRHEIMADEPADFQGPLLSRIIERLVRPPAISRKQSALLICLLTLLIGWIYYAIAGAISLQILYLFPIILAAAWLGLGWGLAVAVASVALRFVADFMNNGPEYLADGQWVKILSYRLSNLLAPMVVAVVVHELVRMSRSLEQRVRLRTEALRRSDATRIRLQSNLFEASRRERNAIGHELHDGVGQHLTATAMAAEVLASRLEDRGDPLAPAARQVEELVREGLEQNRRVARGLLLEQVPPDCFLPELDELASSLGDQGLPCEIHANGTPDGLTTSQTSHLFYIAREALHNTLKHAQANSARIEFDSAAGLAKLAITDDGIGLSGTPQEFGMGIKIMEQRARLAGGRFFVQSTPGKGTLVGCELPTVPCA